MQNIGLMMTYNEDDIIEETMESHKKFFDKIFVLDGSSDKTEEIIRSFDNVKFFLKDQDLYPKRKIRDGARQFLLEKAQEMYGFDGWFTLLHGDEIFVDDPNLIAEKAAKQGAEKVNWHTLNFFLHTSQKDTYDPTMKVQDQVKFYQPGGIEIRQFRNGKDVFYNLNQIYNVTPCGIGYKILYDFPVLKHYVNRSVKQKMKKAISGLSSVRERDAHTISTIEYNDCFKDRLSEDRKVIREFDGSFKEFEPGNRPSFIRQWIHFRHFR